ncbi:MAG: HAD family phosphatase [Acidobacteria bacterium]|nr:MAG: HAD family phosphatase [Acidobacteriota bacterium]REK01256.1 MAG: HAD family phosphatase [Acidobacteriota bacterium]REK14212.1 MAG: HAD family phosphatase [Acidobacteriota bacterium]REK44927.1 MAG: HAD family phosphatase [Acidobacteriota bacterium]
MPIKLLALDLDGTLLSSEGTISDTNKSAIRDAENQGVLVTIATGRRFRDARPVALEAGFNAPILTHNGALIKHAESLETFSVDLLENDAVREILRVGYEHGGNALVSADPEGKGTLFYDNISDENLPLKRYVIWAKHLHGDEAEEAVHHVESLESVVEDNDIIHISFSGNCNQMYEFQMILENELADSVNILATVYPHLDFTLLDILPPHASKAAGLNKYVLSKGISREEVMVVGDNFNDLEMLEYAGTSVVMANADESLLEREEFYTTLGNNEDGVAAAIDRFILAVN